MTAADFTPERVAELREFDHGAIFDELHTFEELEDAWIEMLDAIEELQAAAEMSMPLWFYYRCTGGHRVVSKDAELDEKGGCPARAATSEGPHGPTCGALLDEAMVPAWMVLQARRDDR